MSNPFDEFAAGYDGNGMHAARAAELITVAAGALTAEPPSVILDAATGFEPISAVTCEGAVLFVLRRI